MAARIDPARWYWALAVAALACLVGLLAGRDPTLAIAVSIGLGFLLLTVADLLVGVTIFTVASFLELATVASGVGIAKVLGLALAISWVATIVAGKGRGRLVWLSSPGLSAMIVALLAWGMLSLLWAESTSLAIAQMFRYALVALLVPIVFTAVRNGSGAEGRYRRLRRRRHLRRRLRPVRPARRLRRAGLGRRDRAAEPDRRHGR